MAVLAPEWTYPYGGPEHPDPHPKQAIAHRTVADELLFGGAAGPGKTDWLLGHVLRPCFTWPGFPALILRRTMPHLKQRRGIIERLNERIPRAVGTYNKTDHVWTFANGSQLQLGFLEHDGDVERYVGGEYGIIGWDQVEQFTEYQFLRLKHPLRLPEHHPAILAGYRPHMPATANPGGTGHHWVKARWIDPAPPFVVWQPAPTIEEPDPGSRAFIPATLEDNPAMGDWYRQQLNAIKDPALRKALAEGDWDVYVGARFGHLWRRPVHVVEPEDLPIPEGAGVARGLGVDYGLEAPFCALWGAVLADDTVVIYRELYQAGLTDHEQAAAIRAVEADAGERTVGRPMPSWLDSQCWARNPSEPTTARPRVHGAGQRVTSTAVDAAPKGSIAWNYQAAGVNCRRAHKDRLLAASVIADKLTVRRDNRPRLYVYSTCLNLIRTLPGIMRDEANPELYDTKGEDHAVDALAYLLLGLFPGRRPPGAPAGSPATPPAGFRDPTVAAETAGLRDRPI